MTPLARTSEPARAPIAPQRAFSAPKTGVVALVPANDDAAQKPKGLLERRRRRAARRNLRT